jgi:hypothetical protein
MWTGLKCFEFFIAIVKLQNKCFWFTSFSFPLNPKCFKKMGQTILQSNSDSRENHFSRKTKIFLFLGESDHTKLTLNMKWRNHIYFLPSFQCGTRQGGVARNNKIDFRQNQSSSFKKPIVFSEKPNLIIVTKSIFVQFAINRTDISRAENVTIVIFNPWRDDSLNTVMPQSEAFEYWNKTDIPRHAADKKTDWLPSLLKLVDNPARCYEIV